VTESNTPQRGRQMPCWLVGLLIVVSGGGSAFLWPWLHREPVATALENAAVTAAGMTVGVIIGARLWGFWRRTPPGT